MQTHTNLLNLQQQHPNLYPPRPPIAHNRTIAIRITSFRVPPFVPITLTKNIQISGTTGSNSATSSSSSTKQPHHPLDLAKPLLFDCDYTYEPDLDDRLTVKWFRNDEPEPFYQWLPQRDEPRHFADWIWPLVDQEFITDPTDPLKRYRSLLIRRLSVNLTGQYTCLVSSLAGQDMRRASLVVYQPPTSFTFEHKIFPAQALLVNQPAQSRIANNNNFHHHQQQQIPLMMQHHQQHQTSASNYLAHWPNSQLPLSSSSSSSSSGSVPLLLNQATLSNHQTAAHNQQQSPTNNKVREQPTQFKNLMPERPSGSSKGEIGVLIRPANNPLPATNSNNKQPTSSVQQQQQQTNIPLFGQEVSSDLDSTNSRIVYTHDGRPVGTRRPGASPTSQTGPGASDRLTRRQLAPTTGSTLYGGAYNQSATWWSTHKQSTMTTRPANNDNITQPMFVNNGAPGPGPGPDENTLYHNRYQYHHHHHQHHQAQPNQFNLKPVHQQLKSSPTKQARFTIQLHQFQCQAQQMMPRPLMLLTVKRDSESIAQYLHEASTVSIRPYEVGDDYFEQTSLNHLDAANINNYSNKLSINNNSSRSFTGNNQNRHILYDIRVSATIALNVSLPQNQEKDLDQDEEDQDFEHELASENERLITLSSGINTILNFRPGQRMSFECHLEITGTDFEQFKRLNMDEKAIYQFAANETALRYQTSVSSKLPGNQIAKTRYQQQQQTKPGNNKNNRNRFHQQQQQQQPDQELTSNAEQSTSSNSLSSWFIATSSAGQSSAGTSSIAMLVACFTLGWLFRAHSQVLHWTITLF